MILFFFNNNPPIKSIEYKNACFLWYKKGLLSYSQIDTILSIELIYLEESIFQDFKLDYPDLLANYKFEIIKIEASIQEKEIQEICFLASNDTIFFLLRNVITLRNRSFLFAKKGEGAKVNAEKQGFKCEEISMGIPKINKYDLLVLGNDWGLLEQKINYDFLKRGKNSICIQESVIDFNPVDQRMMHCSLPVFQGIVSLKKMDLRGKVCAVIGNPRYEKLKPSQIPDKKQVLINVNFTYGIFEEIRETWINDILSNCKYLNMDYLISQHPRDTGDLKNYNLVQTNAASVHDVLKSSSLLITRFSSLIHESLLLGRPVIYYNPHGEKLFYDFEPDHKCLFIATNREELLLAMKIITDNMTDYFKDASGDFSEYLIRHLGVTKDDKASYYIDSLIDKVLHFDDLKKTFLKNGILLKLRTLKRKLLNQRA